MDTHTPGPWTVQPIGDETECNILGARRELIATVSDNDARLIAAAPRMLEALTRIVAWIDAGCDPSRQSIDGARAILRDVEG